jgi:hypothetical protein
MNEDGVLVQPGATVTEGERMLRALQALCDEWGCEAATEEPPDIAQREEWPPLSKLSKEGERLAAGLREGLVRLADARRKEAGEGPAAVPWFLDWAQLAVRAELLMARDGRLSELLPTFVYLVVLPASGQAEALRVAERAAQLLGDGTVRQGA